MVPELYSQIYEIFFKRIRNVIISKPREIFGSKFDKTILKPFTGSSGMSIICSERSVFFLYKPY